MCGIAGLFDPDLIEGSSESVSTRVRQMLAVQFHRGPDGEGVWVDAQRRCVLGHRRLSIIDVSDAGAQPMTSASGNWVVTFNGEIYNFEELKRDLVEEGVTFKGRSDTEVLVEAIEAWGIEAVRRFDGMFAFAAFNIQSGQFWICRDPFGEKPLYYTRYGKRGVAFASELQALEQLADFDATVSVDAIAEYLMFQYVGAPRTLYRSVSVLPPGSYMQFGSTNAPMEARYFSFRPGEFGFESRDPEELIDELEDILTRSVKRRMISDVPLGAFLSGGVDSSVTCALVRRKLGQPLKTFSIGFRNAPESEHEAARAFAKHLGTEHHDQILTPSFRPFLLESGKFLDHPNGDSSCLPTYLLAQYARQYVTVALSGDGGDELFGGYGRYLATFDERGESFGGKVVKARPGKAYYSGRILISEEEDIRALFGNVPTAVSTHLEKLRRDIDDFPTPLHCRLRRTDAENYMPGAVLPKVDRMSMQHSLEVRTPYLNVELARFAERLPENLVHRPGSGKLLLKALAYRYLPREMIDSPKKGFGIPMSDWGRKELIDTASELLESDDSRLKLVLGSKAIDGFMRSQRTSLGYSTYRIWAIAVLESWLRHHRVALTEVAIRKSVGGESVQVLTPAQALTASRQEDTTSRPRHAAKIEIRPRWYNVALVSMYLFLVGAWLVFRRRLPGPRFSTASAYVVARTQHQVRVSVDKVRTAMGINSSFQSNSIDPRLSVREPPMLEMAQDLVELLERRINDPPHKRKENISAGSNRIVIVTHALCPGGAERQWCYLANGIKQKGYDVTFVVTDGLVGSNGHYVPLLSRNGIELRDLSRSIPAQVERGTTSLTCDDKDLKVVLRKNPFGTKLGLLVQALDELKPAAVIAQLDATNLVCAAAGIIAGVPRIVLSFRNYNPTRFSYLRNDWFLPLYRSACHSSSVILSGNSRSANDDYAQWIGVPASTVAWIPNAIDPDDFLVDGDFNKKELLRSVGVSEACPVILGVFRLSEEKRPLAFVDVCSRVLDIMPDVHVIVAGEGSMRSEVLQKILDLGLSGRIKLLGRRTDVARLMAASSLLLHTSAFEGMSNVALEAQFLGLPVVATRVGEVGEIVQHDVSGFLHDVEAIDQLTQSCVTLLGDPKRALAMGAAGRAIIQERYSIDRLASNYLALV